MKQIYKQTMMLAAVLLAVVTGCWAQTFESGGLTFQLLKEGDVFWGGSNSKMVAGVAPKSSGKYSGYVTVPAEVTCSGTKYPVITILYQAFYGCTDLTGIDLGSVRYLDDSAFYGCTGLKSIDMKNIKQIGNYCFRESGITSIDLSNLEINPAYSSFQGCKSLESVTLSENCKSLNRLVFSGCFNLKSVNTHNVTSIDNYAFEACRSLEAVDLSNCETLGEKVFTGCSGLQSITFGKMATIPDSYFKELKGLKSIDLAGVTEIGESSFENCSALESLDLKDVTTVGNYAFLGCTSLASIDLGSVSTIGRSAFNTTGIQSLDLKNVESLRGYVFAHCEALQSVNFGNCTAVGLGMFSGCSNLRTIDFGNVTEIPDQAFMNCASLQEVNLNGINGVGESAFEGCTSLTDIDLWNVQSIGSRAFASCSALQYIDLASNNGAIANDAFADCDALSTVVLPYDYDQLVGEDHPIARLAGLEKVYLSSLGTTVVSGMFANNPNLKEVCINGFDAPDVNEDSFNSNTYNGTLYVPYGGLGEFGQANAFSSHPVWGKFREIKEMPYRVDLQLSFGEQPFGIILDIGESVQVSPVIVPAEAAPQDAVRYFLWNNATNAMTVTPDGLLTGISEGDAVLVAELDGIQAQRGVKVQKGGSVSVNGIDAADAQEYSVYNLQGVQLRARCSRSQLNELPRGIYILVSSRGSEKVKI